MSNEAPEEKEEAHDHQNKKKEEEGAKRLEDAAVPTLLLEQQQPQQYKESAASEAEKPHPTQEQAKTVVAPDAHSTTTLSAPAAAAAAKDTQVSTLSESVDRAPRRDKDATINELGVVIGNAGRAQEVARYSSYVHLPEKNGIWVRFEGAMKFSDVMRLPDSLVEGREELLAVLNIAEHFAWVAGDQVEYVRPGGHHGHGVLFGILWEPKGRHYRALLATHDNDNGYDEVELKMEHEKDPKKTPIPLVDLRQFLHTLYSKKPAPPAAAAAAPAPLLIRSKRAAARKSAYGFSFSSGFVFRCDAATHSLFRASSTAPRKLPRRTVQKPAAAKKKSAAGAKRKPHSSKVVVETPVTSSPSPSPGSSPESSPSPLRHARYSHKQKHEASANFSLRVFQLCVLSSRCSLLLCYLATTFR